MLFLSVLFWYIFGGGGGGRLISRSLGLDWGGIEGPAQTVTAAVVTVESNPSGS
jgi:hypothetical protein